MQCSSLCQQKPSPAETVRSRRHHRQQSRHHDHHRSRCPNLRAQFHCPSRNVCVLRVVPIKDYARASTLPPTCVRLCSPTPTPTPRLSARPLNEPASIFSSISTHVVACPLYLYAGCLLRCRFGAPAQNLRPISLSFLPFWCHQ